MPAAAAAAAQLLLRRLPAAEEQRAAALLRPSLASPRPDAVGAPQAVPAAAEPQPSVHVSTARPPHRWCRGLLGLGRPLTCLSAQPSLGSVRPYSLQVAGGSAPRSTLRLHGPVPALPVLLLSPLTDPIPNHRPQLRRHRLLLHARLLLPLRVAGRGRPVPARLEAGRQLVASSCAR